MWDGDVMVGLIKGYSIRMGMLLLEEWKRPTTALELIDSEEEEEELVKGRNE